MGTFGYNLRKIREMRGLSPEQMAEKIGKSSRTYQKIESEERDMTRTEIKEIAKALEIPEELILSMDKGPIYNSFNNNQEGEYFNSYHGDNQASKNRLLQRVSFLEGRLEFLEKLILKLIGESKSFPDSEMTD